MSMPPSSGSEESAGSRSGTSEFSHFTREELETRLREALAYMRLLRGQREEREDTLREGQLQAVNMLLPPPAPQPAPPPPPQPEEDHTMGKNITLDTGSDDAGENTGGAADTLNYGDAGSNSEPEEVDDMKRLRRACFRSRDELRERARL